jgi:hypothetical protein
MPAVQDVIGRFSGNGSILMHDDMQLAQAGFRRRNRRVQVFLGRTIPSTLTLLLVVFACGKVLGASLKRSRQDSRTKSGCEELR